MVDLHIYLSSVLLAYSVYAIALISPGPVNLSVMNISMHYGRKVGFIFVFGIVIGSAVWAIIASLGLLKLLTVYENIFLPIIKTIGGFYLLWMAFNTIKSLFNSNDDKVKCVYDTKLSYKLFFQGFFLNLTNPKTVLSWSAIISIGLENNTPDQIIYITVLGCILISLSIFSIYNIIFSNNVMIKLYMKNRNTINVCLFIVFIYAGYVLLGSI